MNPEIATYKRRKKGGKRKCVVVEGYQRNPRRSRNQDGSFRKKRSDAKPTNKYVKPGFEARVIHALAFIERFENSGEEYIWLEELKNILMGVSR